MARFRWCQTRAMDAGVRQWQRCAVLRHWAGACGAEAGQEQERRPIAARVLCC
ncbi:hypothetical protein ES288_D01G198600v1 [Gossypium darwinii]|uniref:Uncharacterized protein n=1 Tax=Gossypium darwinii TaxID=34276 RepID=A0A5D2DRL5_GOSDA|nr:hypothetical protein ES288_D01G198600v1 [Gossypium darwinii]